MVGNKIIGNKQIASNGIWSLAGKITSLFSSLFVGVLVARYLGPDQYGTMNYAVSFVNLFLILATFGFDNIEIREEAKQETEKFKILGTVFTLRILFSIITFVLISIVACINEASWSTIGIICLYGLSVMITPFDVIRNYFTSIVKNEYIVKISILTTIFSALVKLSLVYLKADLVFFVSSLLLDAITLAAGYIYVYTREIGNLKYWQFSKRWAYFLIRQSFPLLLSGAAATIFLQIDQVMIGNMINKTSVGYFSVASKFIEILIYVPTIFIQTICPILVRLKKEDQKKYDDYAQMFMNITLWTCIISSILMYLTSHWVVLLTFGKKYYGAIAVLQILSFKIIGVALNIISGQLLIIEEKQKLFALRSISGCVACIVLNWIAIPRFGIDGVAVVAIVTQFIAGYLVHIFIPRYRYMFWIQSKAIFEGWKDLYKIKTLIKR